MELSRSQPGEAIQREQSGEVRPAVRSGPVLHWCAEAVPVQSNRQARSSAAAGAQLPDKALSRYQHKINLGEQPSPPPVEDQPPPNQVLD